jgi:cytochrome c biogenesis protein
MNEVKKKKEKSLFDKIWDWLCSLKVNVIILILLALTSIFGTIIPQGRPPADYIKFAGPKWYSFFKATQLDDMYHSFWFVALLGLLCVTITCCSIDKFPIVWRFFSKPKKDLDDYQLKLVSLKETLTLNISKDEALEKYKSFLGNNVSASMNTEIDGIHHLFSQKGLYSRLGVYVTHLSLLIIIIGALIGVFFGLKSYIRIDEFTSASKVYLRGGPRDGEIFDLGFALRLDGYETAYYPNSRQPKDFTSNIVVIDNGKEIFRKYVKVNHTLKYKGFTFYQSNYGAVGDDSYYAVIDIIKKVDGSVVAKDAIIYNNNVVRIPGTKDELELTMFRESAKWGPMAGLKIYKEDDTSKEFWGYPEYPQLEDKREGDYKIIVKKVKPREYTGLQIAKDPGVWIVYAGCGLMILGTLIAFFMSHKRFWMRIEEDKGKVKVTLAATANKNKETFEREFAILKEKFANY